MKIVCILQVLMNGCLQKKGVKILHNQCVGYKVPLFLNGQDDIDNRELSDMEVYWGLMGQMVNSMFR